MKWIVWTVLVMLLVPGTSAHLGSAVPQGNPVTATVERGDTAIFDVLYNDGELQVGDLFFVNAVAAGPAAAQVSVHRELPDQTSALAISWSVPPDGVTHTFGFPIREAGNHSVFIETASEQPVEVALYFSFPSIVPWGQIPYWFDSVNALQVREGTTIFRFTPETTERHQVVVGEPAMFTLETTLHADGAPGAFPAAYPQIASAKQDTRAGVVHHTLEWDAVAGESVYLFAKATEAFTPGQRPLPPGVYLADQFQPTFGPASDNGAPAPPVALLLAALAAVAFAVRRRD